MPHNQPAYIIKDGDIVDNHSTIVPLEQWIDEGLEDIGVLLTNDTDLDSLDQTVFKAPLIAIEFPVFMDGRGFSLARLLRERYHYQGEIRAVGHIIRDQLCYLRRCGFNAFSFDDSVDLQAALASLNDFTEAYQTAVDKPTPLFRRRA